MNTSQLPLDNDGLFRRTARITRAEETGDAREFTGIGVPWGQIIEHAFGAETFDRGSVDAEAAKLFDGHEALIGTITASTETDDGFQITGRISDTARGRDAWTLLKDGAIDSLSIGFEPIEYRVDENEVIHWTRVKAREFSLVPFPAYDQATIDPASLRTERKTMHDTATTTDQLTRADLDPINDTLDDLARQLKRIDANTTANPSPASQWRSMGEFVKAVAAGDEAAADFHRAYTGATTSDTVMKDTFVGDFVKFVDDHRKLVADFTKGTLPNVGTSIDYVQLGTDTTRVEKQADEGADLPHGKITLVDANAKIETAGGWTELSRQLIERATIPTLNYTMTALGLRYAKYTNTVVANAFASTVASQTASSAPDSNLKMATTAKADDWLNTIIDAALIFEENGFNLDQLHVSADIFKALAGLKDGDRRLMNVYGQGINQTGEIDARAVSGELARVPVKLLPGRSRTGQAAFSDHAAIQFLESAGAPAQLQDENIINLTKQFSIYGYMSVLIPFPQAILPIKIGG